MAYLQSSVVLQPRKRPLDLPPTLVDPCWRNEGATAFRLLSNSLCKTRNHGFDALTPQPRTKGAAVVGFVSDYFARAGSWPAPRLRNLYTLKRRLRQSDFVLISACNNKTDGQTITVGCEHNLRAFADLGLTYSRSPFLAGTNEPSKKACAVTACRDIAHSSLLCASREASVARHTRSQTPASSHSFSRRHAVTPAPNSDGTSFQRQPERSTNKIAFKVWRSSARGLAPSFWGRATAAR